MFGAVEQPRSWARHLVRTRQLQLETGGFTEFVPLPFVHMATPIYLQHRSRRGPTFRETLLMHAVGRIAYRHAIENIQVSWVKMGADGVRQILRAGVNDLGGTLMDENISRAAGASHGQMMDAERFAAIVHPLGRSLAQRTTLYGRVEGPGHPDRDPGRRQRMTPASPSGRPEQEAGSGRTEAVDRLMEVLLPPDASSSQRRLYRSMLDTVATLAAAGTEVIDLKVADSALAEMAEAFAVFRPFRKERKVTIFGSARTEPDHPAYHSTRELAATMAGADWMVVTGAGPGIMAAGMEGAGRDKSIGVNIRLPFEQGANAFIAQDPKLVEMRYFFTRKLMLIKESDGYVVLPGGFGTLDEGFELLTLLQTGKAEPAPVVMLDVPGGTYWQGWDEFIRHKVEPRGLVSPEDRALFTITDDVRAGGPDHPGLLPELPVVPVGRRSLGHADAGRSGPGPAGPPQPGVRRHRGQRHHALVEAPSSRAVGPRPSRPGTAGVPIRQDPLRTLRALIDALNRLGRNADGADGAAA